MLPRVSVFVQQQMTTICLCINIFILLGVHGTFWIFRIIFLNQIVKLLSQYFFKYWCLLFLFLSLGTLIIYVDTLNRVLHFSETTHFPSFLFPPLYSYYIIFIYLSLSSLILSSASSILLNPFGDFFHINYSYVSTSNLPFKKLFLSFMNIFYFRRYCHPIFKF